MANYSEIERVVPSQSRLVTAVGRNQRVEEWECIGEVRGRTGKLRREVVGRLDEGTCMRTRRLKTAVSVYGPSRCPRADHCVRKGSQSRIRMSESG